MAASTRLRLVLAYGYLGLAILLTIPIWVPVGCYVWAWHTKAAFMRWLLTKDANKDGV